MLVSYLYLVCTIVFESLGIALLNKAEGVKNIYFLINGLLCLNIGMVTFSMSLKKINMTIANTTWAGLSILCVALIDYFYWGQRYSLVQYLFVFLITIGLIGLNLTGISK